MVDLKNLKNISADDRRLLESTEAMLGPEPEDMGFLKNLFWGNVREELLFPYPTVDPEETARCDQLLAALDDYLRNEHPSVQIDQDQEIPKWCLDRLFELGVMGMTVPRDYGGLGLGITSYNRVLEKIGAHCGSTAVLVSAHQSIGCKAIMLFGDQRQKEEWLPKVAREWVSAFCLSEPQVGSDAGGQETTCELSADGSHYILNGEKKWATSGAYSGLFTVMAKQKMKDPKTGEMTEKVTALVCMPEMEGIDIFSKNRSKCGIRGTWQARIRFTNVKVPKENLLHKEGRGLIVALTCLNFGRCTLSAGCVGAAKDTMEQAIKWGQTRYQFGRPLASFEAVQKKFAEMTAKAYAADAMLYWTTGILDRHDKDVMVETAACKIFSSEMAWEVIDECMQIIGGESYMTENEVERAFRDNRIHRIVEGSNEVMQSFIFGYGGKQLGEHMLSIQANLGWDSDASFFSNIGRILKNGLNFKLVSKALPLGGELFLGLKRKVPQVTKVHPSLSSFGVRMARATRDLSHAFKKASLKHQEMIVSRQAVQARLSDAAMYIHAMGCTLSRLDSQVRSGSEGVEFERDRTAATFFFDIAEERIRRALRELEFNSDKAMLEAAKAAMAYNDTLPNERFAIPESSPIAKGTGRPLSQEGIKQFPGDKYVTSDTSS